LSGPNFAPNSKRLENIARRCSAIGCNSKSTLARQLIYQQQNNEKMNTKQVQEINEAQFEAQVLNSKQPVVVGFLSAWSQASGRFEPVLEEVAGACSGNAKVFKMDVDDNPELGNLYSIQSVPTLIYFFNGTVRVKIIGTVSAKAILAKLQSLLQEKIPPPNKV
jgi:thioredoxin 1